MPNLKDLLDAKHMARAAWRDAVAKYSKYVEAGDGGIYSNPGAIEGAFAAIADTQSAYNIASAKVAIENAKNTSYALDYCDGRPQS